MKKYVLIGMVSASLFVVGCAVVKFNESATPAEQIETSELQPCEKIELFINKIKKIRLK